MVISKIVKQWNFYAEMKEKLGGKVDVKIVTNVLFSRSFHFDSVVGGFNILPVSIKMTKMEKSSFLIQYLDPFQNSKYF